MQEQLRYEPNIAVVRSARSFIRALCESYGHSQGLQVWDQIRSVLGDRAAGDIFLGMLTDAQDSVVIKSISNLKIEAIKELRAHTGWSLKESKDFVEDVQRLGPQMLGPGVINPERMEEFVRAMQRIGCEVE